MTFRRTRTHAFRAFLASFTVFAAATLVAVAAPAEAQATAARGSLVGVVSDSTGGVIVGASVTLRSPSGDFTRSKGTNARGRYEFKQVPQGSYLLDVFRDGFRIATREVSVTAGEAVSVDVTLTPASFSEEITVSFTGEHAQTALKMDAEVRDIPLTVKSYTSSFIKAVDTKKVADLYTYMNGINRDGGTAYDFTIRGFGADDPGNLQYNGMPGMPARFNSPNLANVERIEILKGPASVLYGTASPGGLVNVITKRPLAERQSALDLRFGSFMGTGPSFGDANSFRGGLDLTGPFGDDRKLLYRLIATYDFDERFRDFQEDEEVYLVPAVTWNISDGTILTVEAEYRKLDKTLDQGLIAPQNDTNFVADITTVYQEPGDFDNEEGWSLNAYFTKLFSGGLNWNLNWRSVDHRDERMGFENNRAENDFMRVRRRDRHQINNRTYHFVDTHLSKRFTTGSVEHNFLFGLNGGYEQADFNRERFGNVGLFVDLRNPVYGQPLPEDPNPGTWRITDFYRYGAYVQDQIELSPKWKALASLRYDGEDQNFEEIRFNQPSKENTVGAVVPTGGLVFQPDHRWSFYASYAESFIPPAATVEDEQGVNEFDPESGWQVEGGFKAVFDRGRYEVTASAFHIEKQNVIIGVGGGISEQIGAERSRGVEFDLRLRPVNNWQTILGYTYLDHEVTEDTRPNRTGAKLLNTPNNAFNVWTRYDITEGAADGLGFGLGLIYRGDRAGSFPSQVVLGDPVPGAPIASAVLDLPSYFRADAGVYYVKERWELTFRVNNIFDEYYIESASNLIQLRPGNPREATLSLRLRF